MKGFDWTAFESALTEELLVALRRVGKQLGTKRCYAIALYGVYAEEDGILSLPSLAAATEAKPAATDSDDFWGSRFTPQEWNLPNITLCRTTTMRLERALTAEATRSSVKNWRRVALRYFRVLVRIVRRLRDGVPALLPVTDDFVCFLHDEGGGPELACRTIPRPLIERFFARQINDVRQHREVGAMPETERAKYLIARLDKFDGVSWEDAQRLLVGMRERAVPALLDVLSDSKIGWNAANILGQIGVSTPTILERLRARADSFWHATALGMLGDHAWLAAQAPPIAVNGLCARLRAITQGGVEWPLDFRPLERWLDAAGEQARILVEEELKPGVSPAQIQRTDVDEALRALRGTHAVIRWHAASMLGERELGVSAGSRIVPALVSSLEDSHPVVRRIALVSLEAWKRAAAPYRHLIFRLVDDPDETVRRAAQWATE